MTALDNARANLVNELETFHESASSRNPMFSSSMRANDVVEAIEIFVTNLILHSKEPLL